MSRWLGAGIGLACALAAWAAASGDVAAGEPPARRDVRVRIGGGASLGVSLAEVGAEDVSRLRLAAERGALVRDVEPDSPAAAAGLQKDDVILSYQGEPVHSAAQLSRLVRETPAGRQVALEVSREGASRKLTATLREGRRSVLSRDFDFDFDVPMPVIPPRPPRPPRAPNPPEPPGFEFALPDLGQLWGTGRGRLGLTYTELTDQLASYFKVEDGLLVTRVHEGTPAEEAGIRAGDVIVRAAGRDVRSSGDLRDALADVEDGAEVTLGLRRDGQSLDVKAKLAPARDHLRRRTIRS